MRVLSRRRSDASARRQPQAECLAGLRAPASSGRFRALAARSRTPQGCGLSSSPNSEVMTSSLAPISIKIVRMAVFSRSREAGLAFT